MSDVSKVEQREVEEIPLNYGERPGVEPKKITEQDINTVIKDVVRKAEEERNRGKFFWSRRNKALSRWQYFC